MRRHTTSATVSLAAALSIATALAGCAPGLAANPRFATDAGARPQGQPISPSETAGPPRVETPKSDLAWHD
ncbi:MAG: alpha/beta hydrolase, partial [Mycobacterium sp.]